MSNLSTQIIVGGHAEQALDAMMKTANAVRETAKIAGASAREQYQAYQLSIKGIKEEQAASETALRAKIASSTRIQAAWEKEKVAQWQAVDAAQAKAKADEFAALKPDILARSQTQAASTARAYGDTLRALGLECRSASAAQQGLGESVEFGTSKMAYASASVRTLEGHIGTNTRAVERDAWSGAGAAAALVAKDPDLTEYQRGAKLAGIGSQIALLGLNYDAQSATDQRQISSQTGTGALKNAPQSLRATDTRYRQPTPGYLNLDMVVSDDELVKMMTEKHHWNDTRDWKNLGAGVFKNVADMALQRAEGSALGALGFGKPDGSASNPLRVILAGSKHAIPGAGPAVSGMTKDVGGFLGSIGGFASKIFSGFGFADGGVPPVGVASLVGEHGPELFVPKVAGTVRILRRRASSHCGSRRRPVRNRSSGYRRTDLQGHPDDCRGHHERTAQHEQPYAHEQAAVRADHPGSSITWRRASLQVVVKREFHFKKEPGLYAALSFFLQESLGMAADDRKEDWLLARARGIGGSDVAAVVGLSPWKRPIDIFVAKTQQLPFELPTEAMWWGNYLEAGVRRRYSELAKVEVAYGNSIVKLFPLAHAHGGQTIVASSQDVWRLGTPDGVIAAQRRGLEIKTAGYRSHEWGKVGSDEIPGHYLIQVAWYMAVCEWSEWDVAALFHGNQLEVFRVKRNLDLEQELIKAARAFWHDHVLEQIEPPVDESESYARYLARKYSFSNDQLMPATDEIETMALELFAATAAAETAEAAKQLVKNRIGATLGEHAGCKTTLGKLGWVRPKECDRTEWERLAMSLNPASEQIAEFTTKQAKTPYVQAWFAKEK